jgi:L-fuconate dehydratase
MLSRKRRFGKPVCPHAGGVGLCEYVIHLSLIDYICVSGSMERNVLEFVDHLHEHFLYPCTINKNGRYNVPGNDKEGYSYVLLWVAQFLLADGMFLSRIEMHKQSISEYSWPNGSYWVANPKQDKGY